MAASLGIFFRDYDYEESKQWLVEHQPFLFKAVAFYVVAIFSIKWVQRDRKPFDLVTPLILWNAFLAIFSLLGFLFTTPAFLRVISKHGIQHTYTHISEIQTDRTSGYWCFLWIVSKIPEFVDTFFIVLRKKPLMLMHWYHHALTGYFAFHTFYMDNAYMVWVVWMNYIIHFAMYSYYGLRAMHVRIAPWIAQTITTSQMIQFIITIVWMFHAQWMLATGQKVAATPYGLFLGQFMMWTYLVLWIRFYYQSYFAKGGKKYVAHQNKSEKAVKSQ
ncbi:Elongation of very long chain fatty acids protein [Aphelenchoides fujianensis]|nr:Elongation of very long chain fatty acids protein [Aphelenchoides fujianensis]